MANKKQKLTLSMDIQTSFSNSKAELKKFQDALENLSESFGKNKNFKQYTKFFNDYTRALSKVSQTSLAPKDLNNYKESVDQLQAAYGKILQVVQKIKEEQTQELTTKQVDALKEVEKIQQRILDKRRKGAEKLGVSIDQAESLPFLEKTAKPAGYTGKQGKIYGEVRRELIKLQEELTEAQKKYNTLLNTTPDVTKFTAPFAAMEAGATNAGKSLEELNKQSEQLSRQETANAIDNLITKFFGFQAVIQVGQKAVSSFKNTMINLDESLTSIAAVTGRTREQMWEMVGAYNEMAQRLGTTTDQIAKSSKLYYQQGRIQSEVTKLVEQTAILATTAEIEYATATDYLTAAINGYNIAADEAYRVTDSWSALSAASAVDVNELAVAMSKVASLASASGVELETASAFLSKMLETTREAPENLGTALKTIISRFQDLKKSEEELEDGVDANKVEAALRSAGVALRDSSGQFRDFDTVLMELSKVWDSLSVNTQKYIATVAAGSRQQSRFIALVSDYERNLELIDIAQDSAGASSAQFAVQLTGLKASLNRVSAAWEGFYTSFSEGPSLLSHLLDLVANLIITFKDFGIVQTAVLAFFTALPIKILATNAAMAVSNKTVPLYFKAFKSLVGEAKNFKEVLLLLQIAAEDTTKGIVAGFKNVGKNIAGVVAKFASIGVAILPYAAAIAAVTALAAGVVHLATAEKKRIETLKKEIQATKEATAAAQQQRRTLDNLLEQYKEAKRSGGDLAVVQETLSSQFPELAGNIDLTTASYKTVIKTLEDYRKEVKKTAAENALATIQSQKELDFLEQKKNIDVNKYRYNVGEYGDAVRYKIDGQDFRTQNEAREYIFSKNYKPDMQQIAIIAEYFEANLKELSDTQSLAIRNYIGQNWEELITANGELIDGIEELAEDIVEATDIATREITQHIRTMWIASRKGTTSSTEEFLAQEEQLANKANELIQKFYNKDVFTSAEDMHLLQKVFGDKEEWAEYQEIINEEISRILEQFTNFNDLLKLNDNQTLAIGREAIGELGIGGAQLLLEKLSTVKTREEWQALYGDILKVADEVKRLNSPEFTLDFSQILDVSGDSVASFELLKRTLDNFNTDEAAHTIEYLGKSINLLEIDMESLVSGPLQDYYKSMDALKAASEDGIDYSQYISLMREYGDVLDETNFGWDENTGKIKMNGEAAIESAEAIRKLKLEEQEANIQTALMTLVTQDSTLAAEGLIGSTYEEAAAILVKRSAEIDAMMAKQQSIVVYEQSRLASEKLSGQYREEAEEALNAAAAEYTRLSTLKGSLDSVAGQISQYFNLNNILKSTTASRNYMTNAEKGGKKATDAQTDALEKQKEALEKNKKALQDQVDALEDQKKALEDARNAAKKYVDILADAIQNRLNKELESSQSAVENYYEALNQALQELIDDAQDGLDKLNDEAEKAQGLADTDSKDLKEQADLVINFYDKQIEAIKAKVDAMNKESDALDRLQKIQEARDAYEKARQKTRLTLIEGAGWRFRSDKDAIQSAGENLATSETENQTKLLEQQIKALEDIKSKWQEIAANIGKATSELEKTAAFQNFLNSASPEQLDKLYNQFTQSVGQNNTLVENALQAQNRYEQQNDSTAQGTLAWQIQQWQNAQQQAQIDKNQYNIMTDLNAKAVEDLKKQLLQQLGSASESGINGALQHGLEIITDSAEKVNAINATLEALEELLKKVDMTSEELAQYNQIQNMVGQASLESLLQGGSIYNQLESQVNGIVDLNDQIAAIEKQIEGVQGQIKAVESQINSVDNNIKSLKDAVKEGTKELKDSFKHYAESTEDAVKQINRTPLAEPGINGWAGEPMRPRKAAQGGVDSHGGLLEVHGTRNRPELILNNSQSAGLFNFIDSLTRMPSVSNALPALASGLNGNSVVQNSGTSFENCTFKIESDSDNLEGLIEDLKRQVPFK